MSFCKNCGKQTIEGADFCPYCGTRVRDGNGYCPNCGKKTVEGAPFCPYCGTRVAAEAAAGGTCAVCGEALAPGQVFCSGCGTARRSDPAPAGTPEPAPSQRDTGKRLVVSRRQEPFGSNLVFEVYVDQASAGMLVPGGTVTVKEFSDPVRVDIRCADQATASWCATLSVPPEPIIFIETRLEGHLITDCRLIAEVKGGAVVQQQTYYASGSSGPEW